MRKRDNDHQGPDQPQFLADDREDESVCGAGEKEELLSPLAQANPNRPPDPKGEED